MASPQTVYTGSIPNGLKLAIEIVDDGGGKRIQFVLQTPVGDVPISAAEAQVMVALQPA